MTQFSFNRDSETGAETIAFVGSQGIRIVPDNHANYASIKAKLLDQGFDVAEADLYSLADAAARVREQLARVSPRVMLRGDTVLFDGDEMDTMLTKQIVEMHRSGDSNWDGYVQFLENVQQNPSAASREALFDFLRQNDLVITEDGCFIAYKAVGSDGQSIRGGAEDVTVTTKDGEVQVHKGRIPNPAGAVIEMARSLVADNRDAACARGLHVGTHSFAASFSPEGSYLTVKVNPRDVVSVPHDSGAQKCRVARYEVVEVNEDRKRYEGTSFVLPGDDDDDDFYDDDDFDYDYDDEDS